MPTPMTSRLVSVARRTYRSLVPTTIRRRVRAAIAPPKPRPPRAPAPRPPRRYELPLPSTAPGTDHRRGPLTIEAPYHLYVTKTLRLGGFGAYEPETAAMLLGLADHLRPAVIFDVGANVGPHALSLSALFDTLVVAFEPSPDVAAVLRRLVAANDLRCTVEEAAVGDHDGTATLFISPSDPSTSLQPGFREATGTTTVPLVSLDTYVRSSGLRPGIIKIDAETTELQVLRGAKDLLASRPWIVCELLPGWNEDAIDGLMRSLGYRVFQITDSIPPVERGAIAGYANNDRDKNWLFAPEMPDPSLWEAVSRWRRAVDTSEPGRDLPVGSSPPA